MRLLLSVLWSILWLSSASAQTLYVAAASDLVYCLEDINQQFKRQYPQAQIKVTTGSSGNFLAQIKQNAPYEVYLSADSRYPKQLISENMADGQSFYVYAIGQIALWTNKKTIDVKQGWAVLEQTNITRVAIANPEHAPYGQAARNALQQAKLWTNIQSKLVFGENIAQTLQFAQTGNADLAIVALSLLRSPQLAGQGQFWLIPAHLYPPLEQAMVITKRGQKNPLAHQYASFIKSTSAQKIFAKYGFLPPARNLP